MKNTSVGWIYIIHKTPCRKLPDGGITSHMHVDKVTTFIPALANAHDQLTEAAAALNDNKEILKKV